MVSWIFGISACWLTWYVYELSAVCKINGTNVFVCQKCFIVRIINQNISIVGVSYLHCEQSITNTRHLEGLICVPGSILYYSVLVHFVLITYLLPDNKYMYINQHVFKFESFVLMSTAGNI